MKVSLIPMVATQKHVNPNFKCNIEIDIGGSAREGSKKFRTETSETGQLISFEHSTVNELGHSKFRDAEDFVDRIANDIKRKQFANEPIVNKLGLPESENIIQNIAIFLPSYTSGERVFYFPNLRNANDKPLKDIDFSHFKEKLIEKGVKVSPEMKFKVLQDAIGTGLAMAQRLYDADMLHEGDYYTACITGGGCGVSNIRAISPDHIIVESSGSSYLSQSLSLQKVSRAGASAPALISNFCRAMGMSEEFIDDIKSCHKAEFVLNPEVQYEKNAKTEKLKNLLVETGMFEVVDEDDEEFTITVKDGFEKQYDISRESAIDKYCLALARLAIIKKNEGSNGMIVTGTLAKAVNTAAKLSYKMSLPEWVMQHLTGFNSDELNKLQAAYGFKVICDRRFYIDNNTECKKLVHLAEFVGDHRSNWLRVNTKHLKENSINAVKKIKI